MGNRDLEDLKRTKVRCLRDKRPLLKEKRDYVKPLLTDTAQVLPSFKKRVIPRPRIEKGKQTPAP